MALLTIEERKNRFKRLGYGEYNKASILKFQKDAFSSAKWHDGVYGTQTDNALRTYYNCSLVKNFSPKEVRCNCGRCSGYPNYLKQVELRHLQKIRDHYGKPMEITSALRCEHENSAVGGIPNSSHMRGYAVDFYMKGVTDTVENRNESIKFIKGLPNHQFTYGAHMRDSDGKYRESAGMGNAMHTETHRPAKKEKKSKYYNVDVIIGEARCNEFGKLSGGKPGDQTGKEVGKGSWYNGGWLYMFRAKNEGMRLKLAQAMLDTCGNSNIGYNIDKPNRYAAWDNAEKKPIKDIDKKGDTTCSQAVSMCMRACGIPVKNTPRHMDIATMTKVMLKSPYFAIHTEKKYLKSSKYLQAGDILLSSHHTVIVVKSPNNK